MNVAQLINAANPFEVVRLYAVHWTEDGWADVSKFLRFKFLLNESVGIRGDMRAVVCRMCGDQRDDGIVRYEVDGLDGRGKRWGLEFRSWSEWKLMEVVDQSGENLSTDMLAMNLYYEMTWYGLDL
jgi:hypothetical protein